MKQRIFIAEDDPSIQEIYAAILTRAGYEIEISPDGSMVYEKKHQWPSLFILDRQLAGFNGLDICKYLKSRKATKDIPIIMISATPGLETLAKAAGAEDYLEKPFTIALLLDKIRKWIQQLRH
jgi:DNA-binding response OmpR family regulator